jgi:hypothetical protein
MINWTDIIVVVLVLLLSVISLGLMGVFSTLPEQTPPTNDTTEFNIVKPADPCPANG